MEEKQQTYTIAEDFKLPSGGSIYDIPVNPVIKLRAMTGRDEMRRLNPTTTQFRSLAELIENCMIEKPKVHVYDMSLGDYEYLLHRLRVVSYGDAYKIILTCPFCGETINTEIHLDELAIKKFDINKFNELRSFKLPVSQHSIKIKFQTPRMLDELDAKVKESKRKYKDAEIDFSTLLLLESVIEEVDGIKLDPLKAESFFNSLPAKDIIKIENNLDALNASIGLDNRTSVTCKSCGGDVPTTFRFGSEFFRPTNI